MTWTSECIPSSSLPLHCPRLQTQSPLCADVPGNTERTCKPISERECIIFKIQLDIHSRSERPNIRLLLIRLLCYSFIFWSERISLQDIIRELFWAYWPTSARSNPEGSNKFRKIGSTLKKEEARSWTTLATS